MNSVVNELIGKKVVMHVINGSAVAEHRGTLITTDGVWFKLQKDHETFFFCVYNIQAIRPV